jgi:ferredoxin-type protein NapG
MPSDPATQAPARSGRRDFLAGSLGAAASAALIAGGGGVFARHAGAALPAQALRPPGALQEDAFAAACIRCGLCVRDCPYGTLKLGRFGDGVGPGTPYFTAREVACEMCEDIPCIQHCPSGALDHGLKAIDQARMGLAVLVDQENCLNFLGLRCDVCYRVCPAIDRAITLEKLHNPRSDRHALFLPTVHSEHCTGCGKCEKSCVLEAAAIKVLPLALAQGRLGAHYRKGWEEKEKAGRALLDGIETPDVRRPDSMAGDARGATAPASPDGGRARSADELKEGFK